jgi:hypothetical protein
MMTLNYTYFESDDDFPEELEKSILIRRLILRGAGVPECGGTY